MPPVSVTVVPINWSVLNKGLPTDANSVRMGSILNNTNRYALTTWYTAKGYASSSQQAANYLDFGGTDETHIRPAAVRSVGIGRIVENRSVQPERYRRRPS